MDKTRDAALRAALEACVASLERANTSEGYCCCGSSVESHGFGDGHSPVDVGEYHAGLALEAARKALAQPPADIARGGEDARSTAYDQLDVNEVIAWLEMRDRIERANGEEWSYEGVAAQHLRRLATPAPAGDGAVATIEAWQSARDDAHEAAQFHGNDPRVARRLDRVTAYLAAHPPAVPCPAPSDAPADDTAKWCAQDMRRWAAACKDRRGGVLIPGTVSGEVYDVLTWAADHLTRPAPHDEATEGWRSVKRYKAEPENDTYWGAPSIYWRESPDGEWVKWADLNAAATGVGS